MTDRNEIREERINQLIRGAYRKPEDLGLPVDFARKLRQQVEAHQAPSLSWTDRVREWFSRPLYWAPAGAVALVAAFWVLAPSPQTSTPVSLTEAPPVQSAVSPQPEVVESTTVEAVAVVAEEPAVGDPLGPEFFQIDERDNGPIVVEVAEGWNAITIDDGTDDAALVYFYETNPTPAP